MPKRASRILTTIAAGGDGAEESDCLETRGVVVGVIFEIEDVRAEDRVLLKSKHQDTEIGLKGMRDQPLEKSSGLHHPSSINW